jgi:hypothetical protein
VAGDELFVGRKVDSSGKSSRTRQKRQG